MAWFLNFYKCARCKRRWTDEWSCMCDDTCPHCGARDMTPYQGEELTTLIEEEGKSSSCSGRPKRRNTSPTIVSLVASHRGRRHWSSYPLTVEPAAAPHAHRTDR